MYEYDDDDGGTIGLVATTTTTIIISISFSKQNILFTAHFVHLLYVCNAVRYGTVRCAVAVFEKDMI